MADHAGGRCAVVNPGTKLWRSRSNTVLAPKERFWRPFFVRSKKIILIKRRGNSMNQNLLEMIQVTVWLHTKEFFFVFTKTKTGAKTELLRRAGATECQD